MTKRVFAGLLVCVSVVLSGCGSEASREAEAEAVKAAESWLTLVDEEKYAESWDEAAEIFKGAIPQDEWAELIGAARKPFGEQISRKLHKSHYKTALPGAPDGEYVVIQFKASFAEKSSALETVTPMKDTNGVWRVSGYYMK
jgi:hypothetical protein